jgi:hypothetical protein
MLNKDVFKNNLKKKLKSSKIVKFDIVQKIDIIKLLSNLDLPFELSFHIPTTYTITLNCSIFSLCQNLI